MITINQYNKKTRKKIYKKSRAKLLNKCPQLKGECIRIVLEKPKKPNSAIRKLAKLELSTKRITIALIPGVGHKLSEHSEVLVRGGRVKDMPGVKFKLVKGQYDFSWNERFCRQKALSKYGISKKTRESGYYETL